MSRQEQASSYICSSSGVSLRSEATNQVYNFEAFMLDIVDLSFLDSSQGSSRRISHCNYIFV